MIVQKNVHIDIYVINNECAEQTTDVFRLRNKHHNIHRGEAITYTIGE